MKRYTCNRATTQFLYRSNIGNAKIAGMQQDLNLGVDNRYAWLLTIFYISYIVFEFQIM